MGCRRLGNSCHDETAYLKDHILQKWLVEKKISTHEKKEVGRSVTSTPEQGCQTRSVSLRPSLHPPPVTSSFLTISRPSSSTMIMCTLNCIFDRLFTPKACIYSTENKIT